MKRLTRFAILLIVMAITFQSTIGLSAWLSSDIVLTEVEENSEQDSLEKDALKEVKTQHSYNYFQNVVLGLRTSTDLSFFYIKLYYFEHSRELLNPPQEFYS